MSGWPLNQFKRGPNDALPVCPVCGTGKLRHHTTLTTTQAGLVDYPSWLSRLASEGIEIRGGGADEAPECYKRLSEVLAHHSETVRVLHTLRPIGVAMAGRDEFDPFKD